MMPAHTFTIPGQPVAQGRHRVRVVGKFAHHYMPPNVIAGRPVGGENAS